MTAEPSTAVSSSEKLPKKRLMSFLYGFSYTLYPGDTRIEEITTARERKPLMLAGLALNMALTIGGYCGYAYHQVAQGKRDAAAALDKKLTPAFNRESVDAITPAPPALKPPAKGLPGRTP